MQRNHPTANYCISNNKSKFFAGIQTNWYIPTFTVK